MTSTSQPTGSALLVRGGEAELLGLPSGGGFGLLTDSEETGAALSASRLTLADGADGAQPHRHLLSSEFFYVLDGAAEFLLGDEIQPLGKGDFLVIPPGLPHAFGAVRGSGADLLVGITPGVQRFGYFRMLQRVAEGRDRPESLIPVQERYDVHFLDGATWQIARRGRPSAE
ncbi:cupin domain-containing protein [Actinomadura citrea]|uniref:cupin domain-containing protein n=1 Tax=Actinomadura citrea TaxID=46158 RepID=UPI002E2C1EEF|nr:cupin domain-containing protein [Actinomadura citrea]